MDPKSLSAFPTACRPRSIAFAWTLVSGNWLKTLEMRDPTGGFGLTRALITPDGQYFAYGTLRQLSELYVLQGLR